MSEQNVDALRQGYDALARGDLAAALAPLDSHVQVEDHYWSLGCPFTRLCP